MKARPYTSEEDEIIRRHASGGSAEIRSLLVGRPTGSIQYRAMRLGVALGVRMRSALSNPDGGTIAATAALRDRILAHEAAIAERHGVTAGEARAIAIYGTPAIARFSRTTSTKGQDHVGR